MRRRPHALPQVALAALVVIAILAPSAASAATGGLEYGASQAQTQSPPGGVDPAQPLPAPVPVPGPAPAVPITPVDPIPGEVAQVLPDGLAVAPAGAPPEVHAIIAAGNRIARKRYLWGGGHARWEDRGYDCSGSVSYALHGAGLLDSSMASGGFMRWGDAGPGRWVTIYSHRGHMFMIVAGLRFDTSGQKKAGTRWQAAPRSAKGFRVRHPAGL